MHSGKRIIVSPGYSGRRQRRGRLEVRTHVACMREPGVLPCILLVASPRTARISYMCRSYNLCMSKYIYIYIYIHKKENKMNAVGRRKNGKSCR